MFPTIFLYMKSQVSKCTKKTWGKQLGPVKTCRSERQTMSQELEKEGNIN